MSQPTLKRQPSFEEILSIPSKDTQRPSPPKLQFGENLMKSNEKSNNKLLSDHRPYMQMLA